MRVSRKRSSVQALMVCVASLLPVSACTPGQHPFLVVQLCVANAQGVAWLKETLQDVAQDEHMDYVDGSEATLRDLRTIEPRGIGSHRDGGIVNVGVESDAHGLTATNLGLNKYDITVGFGPDTEAAQAFAHRVVARLSQHWTLQAVPRDSGAFPDPRCTEGGPAPPNNSFKPTPLRGAA